MRRLKNIILGYIFFFRKQFMGKWNYFLWHQDVSWSPVIKKYYCQPCQHEQLPSQVIFMANGLAPHGGLADRLKGILSVYSWCLSRNIEFKIHFINPFHLDEFLLPNDYDWIIDDKDVFFDNSIKVSCIYTDSVSHSFSDEYFHNQAFCWMDQEWLKHHGQIHVYTNLNICKDDYSKLFSSLFKKSEKLNNLLAQSLSAIGHDYISISFRFTSLLGDFTDTINSELPDQEKNLLIEKCLGAINLICSKHSTNCKVLITSDSEVFLARVVSFPRVYVLPGKSAHIEHDEDSTSHLKTFLDFFAISNATKAYLVKAGQMYNSDFSRTAALIGNIPFELVEI